MPLDHGYGVAIGQLYRFYREDPDDYGRYYHGFIELDVNGDIYQCAIDVDTHNDEITVQHRIVEITADDISDLLSRENGYYDLESSADSGAIDYIRSKYLLPIRIIGCIPGLFIKILPIKFHWRVPNNPDLWSSGTGAETLDILENLINDGSNSRVPICQQ